MLTVYDVTVFLVKRSKNVLILRVIQFNIPTLPADDTIYSKNLEKYVAAIKYIKCKRIVFLETEVGQA